MTSPSATAAPPAAAPPGQTHKGQTYEDLTGSHDWETHLPPSPEGRLLVSADYCPECGAGVRFLLNPDGAILAARFSDPGGQPGSRSLFTLQHGRMEPADPEPAGGSWRSTTTARNRRGPSPPFRAGRIPPGSTGPWARR